MTQHAGISSEQVIRAVGWLNGEDSSLSESDVRDTIRALVEAFRSRCLKERPGGPVARFRGLNPVPLSLSRIMAGPGDKPPAQAAGGTSEGPRKAVPPAPVTSGSPGGGVSSVQVIEAVSHAARKAGHEITMSRAQLILYCIYGSWFLRGQGRLEIEAPQVWKYGPVFPSAYRKGRIRDRDECDRAYRELQERDPALAAAVLDKTLSMTGTPMADLVSVHKGARSPYARAAAMNPGRWGGRIPDELTEAFFAGNRKQ